ncbi:MAG: hypothetical protein FJ399_03875, partial [Verrucomicrobia bacterium]|nr:hypothetical protein [Verrucomicrobiota bacterium]
MLNFLLSRTCRLLPLGNVFSAQRQRSWFATVALWLTAGFGAAPAAEPIDLDGAWRFAIDPAQRGEENGWHQPGLVVRDWSEVQTPHCWTIDPRFPYVGSAWYRRTFSVPADAAGQHARLAFARVFHRAKIWINGQL